MGFLSNLGKSWFTKYSPVNGIYTFLKQLGFDAEKGIVQNIYNGVQNSLGNSNYASFGDQINSWLNSQTGADLTGAQQAQNAWTEQMDNTKYQRAVTDMQNAGLNPALMMSTGASPSTPTGAQGQTAGASMSQLMSLLTLKPQLNNLEAQTRKINADASLSEIEAKHRDEILTNRTSNLKVENERAKAQISNINMDTQTKEKLYSYIDREKDLALRSGEANIKEVEERVNDLLAKRPTYKAEIDKMMAEANSINSKLVYQIQLLKDEHDLNDSRKREIETTIDKLTSDMAENYMKCQKLFYECGIAKSDFEYYRWNHSYTITGSVNAGYKGMHVGNSLQTIVSAPDLD